MDERSQAFDHDVAEAGAYRYTSDEIESARMANERYTSMILGSADFKGKSVVDVGCGDGTFTAHLFERAGANSILGVEPAPKAIERASETYSGFAPALTFRCATSDLLLQQGRRFDIAVYRGVIHHVLDPALEIRNALQLAPEVIILEPNGCNPLMKIVEKLSPYHRSHQEQSYTPQTVSNWITSAGGTVQQTQMFGLVPYFCPAHIARMGRFCEYFVEKIPVIRTLLCGQYIITAMSKLTV